MATGGGEPPQEMAKKSGIVTNEGDVAVAEPQKTQHDHLITEIESADGHLGSTLRAVYDGEEPADKFTEKLETRIKAHDKEIERMCNYHHQGFIESIRGLLRVRSDVENLRTEINITNSDLQSSSTQLVGKAGELIKCHKTQRNISLAIDTMSICLPVLENYGKLREQMNNKRYYPALKTLEQLEHTYLPRVQKYRFSQAMCDTIPKLRESIKDASMSDLKDFLENIRKHSERIGQIAMKHAAEQHKMDPALAIKRVKKRRAPAPPNPFTGEIEAEGGRRNPFDDDDGSDIGDVSEGMSAQDLIDFSPVYRCLHIHSVLGARENFEVYYRKQRKKQARLALQPPPNMHETLEGYKKYFHDIVGFFVVEEHILNTAPGLVTRAYMDQLWEMALQKIVAALRIHTAFCTDASLMLQIKNLIMLFCHTLRDYGFPVSQLYELLLEIRDQYSEILMKKWVAVFNSIFDEDNYTPITVQDEIEYEEIVGIYPYHSVELEQERYPKRFPFSSFVPKIYTQVKKYIDECLKFSEDLHLSQTEIDDMIRKLANVLLTRTLGGCLSSLIKRPHLGLLQLIQISINMNYLEKSCIYLEEFICNITGSEKDSMYISRLQGTSMFKDARHEAEEQIYKQINEKIDEFLELANYDWMIAEPMGHASGYITDLISFLQSTFLSFTNLPQLFPIDGKVAEKVAQTACMLACKHIAQAMMDFLLDNEVKSLSSGALQQLNLDLLQCEQFSASEPVPGINDGTLQMAFLDLRQLLNLFLAWDWSTYLADYGKDTSIYLRVNPASCITLLEKLKDADKKKNNLLTSFKRNERDKKKLMDTVLKQLRQLANGHIHP